MWLPLKKATIKTTFYTDGDYSIKPNTIRELGLKRNGEYYITGEITYDQDSPESLGNNPWYAVKTYLQKLMVSFEVSYTHYYVLGDLYHMIGGILKKLSMGYLDYDGLYHLRNAYDGNYEETEINITMERDTEDPREKIDRLPLKPRVIKALNDGGIFTIGELQKVTPDLQSIKGIGPGSVIAISEALQAYGVTRDCHYNL